MGPPSRPAVDVSLKTNQEKTSDALRIGSRLRPQSPESLGASGETAGAPERNRGARFEPVGCRVEWQSEWAVSNMCWNHSDFPSLLESHQEDQFLSRKPLGTNEDPSSSRKDVFLSDHAIGKSKQKYPLLSSQTPGTSKQDMVHSHNAWRMNPSLATKGPENRGLNFWNLE